MMLLLHSIAGAAVEPIDDINYLGRKHVAIERQYSPLENAVALVVLVAMVSIPWFIGAAWLAVWAYRVIFSPDVSAIGSDII